MVTNKYMPFFVAESADQVGTLTVTGSRISGRNPFNVVMTLTDPDGIARITAATFTSLVDSQTSDRLSQFSRTDANTFGYNSSLRNARWARASVSITYVDGNGVVSTLTGSYVIT